MNWIKVEKKLPEVGEKVLVCIWGNNILMGKLYHNGWAAFYADTLALCHEDKVTHWMPLPELPVLTGKELAINLKEDEG